MRKVAVSPERSGISLNVTWPILESASLILALFARCTGRMTVSIFLNCASATAPWSSLIRKFIPTKRRFSSPLGTSGL